MGASTFESIEALDAELARRCHGAAAPRLSLGRGLEALARIAGHHERGFPSLEAYALERCERGTRWVQESRRLARSLEGLPLEPHVALFVVSPGRCPRGANHGRRSSVVHRMESGSRAAHGGARARAFFKRLGAAVRAVRRRVDACRPGAHIVLRRR
jgi:hypothetical protein